MAKIIKKENGEKFISEVGKHKDSFDLLKKNLELEFGIFVYPDPYWEHSCEKGFIISNKKMTEKEIKDISSDLNEEE